MAGPEILASTEAAACRGPSTGEALVGSNVDVRTVLHFKLPDDKVQALLPADWQVDPPAEGSARGANLRVTLIDPVAAYDAQGLPRPTVSFMHLGIPARRRDESARGLMLFAGLSPKGAGPYGVNEQAVAQVERRTLYDAGCRLTEESWAFAAASGTSVSMRLRFERADAARETASLTVYSRAMPQFCRIYRYAQSVDPLQGHAVDGARLQVCDFRATGGPLAPLFDGAHRLISVVSVPSYARQVFLPGVVLR